MSDTQPTFKNVQYEFTAHLRDPERNPAPADIEDRRMQIYRGLLFKNVQGFLASGFPVIRKLYSDDDWHNMVRDFFSTHQSQSPYFKDISKEFIDYLNNEREPRPEDPIFLNELAHYEWLEIVLSFLDADIDWDTIDKQGKLLTGTPVLSPFAQLNRYQFPVHKIRPEFQPDSPADQPTFIVVYRDLNDKVGFMEVNPMTARLIELVANNQTQTSEEILMSLADEIPSLDQQVVIHGGHTTLTQLRDKDILLGVKTSTQ